jgi:Phage integrase family
VLASAVKAADVQPAKLGVMPIRHVTFHGLRRTFASLRSYGGKSHRQTADLLGHEDVRFTLNVYAQSGLEPDEMLPPVRQAFEEALEWAAMASNGTRTHDLLHGKCQRCSRPCAPVRSNRLITPVPSERTPPNASERRILPFLPPRPELG